MNRKLYLIKVNTTGTPQGWKFLKEIDVETGEPKYASRSEGRRKAMAVELSAYYHEATVEATSLVGLQETNDSVIRIEEVE